MLCPDREAVPEEELDEVYLPPAREIVAAVATMPRLERPAVQLAHDGRAIARTAELPRLPRLRRVNATRPTAAVAALLAHVVPARDVQLALAGRLPAVRHVRVGRMPWHPPGVREGCEATRWWCRTPCTCSRGRRRVGSGSCTSASGRRTPRRRHCGCTAG